MGAMSVVLLLPILVPLFIGGILAIILLAGKSRPQEGRGPRATTPGGPATGGTWNARILSKGFLGAVGGTLGSDYGVFHVYDGQLGYVPDGATEPAWTVPCSQVKARAHNAFAPAGVDLWLPDGHVRCNVSREHVNMYVRNSIKTLREAKYYGEFVDALVANGATRA